MRRATRNMNKRTGAERQEHDVSPPAKSTPEAEEQIEAQRFWDTAELSDACATLSPYKREHFVISFNSFDEYAAWRDEQTNPWNR